MIIPLIIILSIFMIIKLGNPLLRVVSKRIDNDLYGSEYLHNLADILYKEMLEERGIGLAAPQIGINFKKNA